MKRIKIKYKILILCITIFSCLTLYQVSKADLLTQLELRYSFDETSGTSITDNTGNLYTGSLVNGASRSTSVPGSLSSSTRSVSLDGVDDYIESNSSVTLPGAFTMSMWVYLPQRPVDNGGLIGINYNNSFYLSSRYDGYFYFSLLGNPSFPTTGTLPLTTWSHVATTYDGTNVKIYVDGVLTSTTNVGNVTLGAGKVRIGSLFGPGASTGHLNGLVDDARVYTRALSDAEVLELYNDIGTIPPDYRAPTISSVATSTTLTTATITWNTDESANSTVNYGATSSYGNSSTSAAYTTSHAVTLTGLSSATTYNYQLVSADATGNSTSSQNYIITTGTPDFSAPVISAIATSTGTTTATITWTTDDLSDTQVEYGLTSSYTASSTLNLTATRSHSVTITGLTSGTTYNFRIRSRNNTDVLGTSSNQTFTVATPGPTIPTYVSAKALTPDYVNVIWYRSTDTEGTITSYKVYRDGSLIATVNPIPYDPSYQDTAQNFYIDREVTPGNTYNYYVTATDSVGYISPNSAIVTATTPSGSTGVLLPNNRKTDWTPGVTVGVIGGIDQYISGRTNLIDVTQSPYNADNSGATDAKPAIQAAIDAAVNNDVVYLPAGTYRLNGGLYLQNRNNITIRGAGMDQTILDIRTQGISVRGTGVELGWGWADVLTGAAKGSTQITVADASSYNVGDLLALNTLNDFDVPMIGPTGGSRYRYQYTRITSKSGNTVNFHPAIVSDVHPTETRATVVPAAMMASNIGLEDFTIDGTAGTVQSAIGFSGTMNSWVKNVKAKGFTNYGITLSGSVNCEVRHSDVKGSNTGSNGAGILTGGVSSCLIEDNILQNAFPLIEVNGSTGNVIAYNHMTGSSSNTNHGPYNDFNLYEGNYAIEFKSDGYFGGESNATFFRNNLQYFSFKRLSRDFNVIGNIADVYSIGQPNIGNGGSSGVAQPSQGVYWLDWNRTIGPTITGIFTKASSTEGTFLFDDHDDAVRLFGYMQTLWWGSACIQSSTFMTCDSPSALDWGLGVDEDKYRMATIHSLDLTTDIAVVRAMYPTGSPLPDSGTVAGLWPRSEGFQELDMDVRLTTLFKKNKISGAILSYEELPSGETVPDSLFRTSKPAYFGNLSWPPFDPEDSSVSISDLPAGYRFLNNGQDPVTDTTNPTLTELTAISSPTSDNTPTYVFNSSESGTISYGGSCTSNTTSATTGSNSITFNSLSDGTYSNCTIRVTDGSSNASNILTVPSFTVVYVADTTAPTISALSSGTPSQTGTTISWTTNETANSKVVYGTSAGTYTGVTTNASFVTSHSQSITGLSGSTQYYYRVVSADSSGNTATSSEANFTTSSVADVTAPVISSVSGGSPSSSGTSITWTTNESASSKVVFGTVSGIYGLNVSSSLLTTQHSQVLASLSASTQYYFRVVSVDLTGNTSTSTENSFITIAETTSGGSSGSSGGGSGGGRRSSSSNNSNETTSNEPTEESLTEIVLGLISKIRTIINERAAAIKNIVIPEVEVVPAPIPTPVQEQPIVVMPETTIIEPSPVTPPPVLAQEAPVTISNSRLLFTRDLDLGNEGEDVRRLQKILNMSGYSVAQFGPGSKGQETIYFTPAVQQAVKKFQEAKGITPATGYFGEMTRQFIGE